MSDLPFSFQFKIDPKIIPATDIIRDGIFPSGRGGFGDVWKCSMTTQSGTRRLVAVKSFRVLSTTDDELIKTIANRIRREAYVWIQLNHDHILPLEGVTIAGEFGPLPALVSPWMEQGSLHNYLKRVFSSLSDPQKLELIWQVAAGLSYLHDMGIVHGNLTATNVLVDGSGCLRLADFGLSMILAEAGDATFSSLHSGDLRWMPPEAFQTDAEVDDEDETKDEKPTKAWDVYSFGCVALQIFSGNQPYAWIRTNHVPLAIIRGHMPFKDISSHEVYQQLSPCLNNISANRPTINDIMDVLSDLGRDNSATRHPVPELKVVHQQPQADVDDFQGHFDVQSPVQQLENVLPTSPAVGGSRGHFDVQPPAQQLENVLPRPPAVVDDSRGHFDVQPPAQQLENVLPRPPAVVDDSRGHFDVQPPAQQLGNETPPAVVDDSRDHYIGVHHAPSAPPSALHHFSSSPPSQPDVDIAPNFSPHPWRRFFSRRAPSARTVGQTASVCFILLFPFCTHLYQSLYLWLNARTLRLRRQESHQPMP
ncbi:kinase-like domain-containing protein [Suillus subaureus]|uniref:Kinase-like domain-containing protein n=1 Tax=Suillus subaureus TaxID=48587 RepID=A0A9P7DVF2_9AGAM|nr:kinase-like domain-containing protein [Suillus subaureus]KAG1803955.1 kinase-like domain-containing protein [Suillus subaureus]